MKDLHQQHFVRDMSHSLPWPHLHTLAVLQHGKGSRTPEYLFLRLCYQISFSYSWPGLIVGCWFLVMWLQSSKKREMGCKICTLFPHTEKDACVYPLTRKKEADTAHSILLEYLDPSGLTLLEFQGYLRLLTDILRIQHQQSYLLLFLKMGCMEWCVTCLEFERFCTIFSLKGLFWSQVSGLCLKIICFQHKL